MPQPRLDSAVLVGSGLAADVLAWGEGRVLKLFRRQGDSSNAEREFAITRAVHQIGIPVPAAHDVVEVEGRYGIIFDRVTGPSLIEYVQSRPWMLLWAANQLAELHARLHECPAPIELPSQRRQINAQIDGATGLSEAERDAARRALYDLPEGTALCHGDFHPGNILISSRGPVIIDWERAARGNPSADVACTSRLFQHADLPGSTPSYIRLLFTMSRALLHEKYLRRYLQLRSGSREQIEAWKLPMRAAAPTGRLRQVRRM